MLSVRMGQCGGLPDDATSEVIEAAALFEVLTGRVPGANPSQGLAAAVAIYQHAISAAPLEVRKRILLPIPLLYPEPILRPSPQFELPRY